MDAYKKGFIDGMRCHAHWNDGKEWVGTTGMTLKEAVEKVKTMWNYTPPEEESVTCYTDLIRHHGHLLVIQIHGSSGDPDSGTRASLVCYDCDEILMEFDRYSEDPPDEKRIRNKNKG